MEMRDNRGREETRSETAQRCGIIFLCFACLTVLACDGSAPPLENGRWRAWLDSPGGDLPFGLEIRENDGRLEATLINGEERIDVPRVERTGDRLLLAIDHYDSAVTAAVGDGGRRLDGEWRKTSGPAKQARLAFHAEAGVPAESPAAEAATLERIVGRWSVDFESDDKPAVAIFRSGAGGTLLGTFLTTTGDYRYLAGSLEGDRLRLSCFDGAHAFLFDARLGEDGSLAGDFWSRDSWHERWTARRDAEVSMPDAFELTRWVGGEELDEVVFPDLDGRPRALGDEEFAGRARILEIFGSWCPNCNDAAVHLAELHREYGDRGLSIVGLAFEMTGEFERDAEQVRRYAEHHGLRFPLLVAGVSNKDRASESFPLLDRIRSYPTTVFLHADGRVRAVHQGFSGPATGPAHQELRARFRFLIEELLAER